jgi:hypothetical protein
MAPWVGPTEARIKAAHNRLKVAAGDALKFLKAQRQAQGLSLSDVEQRTGIEARAPSPSGRGLR